MNTTWRELNATLRKIKTETKLEELIEQEKQRRPPRQRWLHRMNARRRRLQVQRERREAASA